MKEVNSSRSNLISSDDENENIDGKPVGGCRRIILTGGNKINLSKNFLQRSARRVTISSNKLKLKVHFNILLKQDIVICVCVWPVD